MNSIIALIILLTGFFPVAIFIKELLQILVALVFAPSFGMVCDHISFCGFTFIRREGKWTYRYIRSEITLLQHDVKIDLKRCDPEKANRNERIFEILRIIILLVISVCLVILSLDASRELTHFRDMNALTLLFVSGAWGLLFLSISKLLILLYVYLILMKGLTGYMESLINRIRQGESFTSLGMKPVDALSYPNATKLERMMYHNLYLTYLIEAKKYDEMKPIISEMTEYYQNREYIIQDTPGYYMLVFYYSVLEPQEDMAEYFFEKVKNAILTDPDANAKRILACYLLNVVKNHELARKYTDEGLLAVEKFSTGAERELERRLLLELNTTLDELGLPSTVLS